MPKRVIDFDAMWGSDKIASCADWAQAEYAWLYGLADASGCFEITNLRVIWGRVAAIRHNLSIERLEQIFHEFQEKGLLFVWEHEGKRYAHWTGSDVPGRLPPPSWRMRLERFAPPVPKQKLTEYMARFARGRAALAGAGFRGEERYEGLHTENLKLETPDLRENRTSDLQAPRPGTVAQGVKARCAVGDHGRDQRIPDPGLKARVEATPAQDLDWNWNKEREERLEIDSAGNCSTGSAPMQAGLCTATSNPSDNLNGSEPDSNSSAQLSLNYHSETRPNQNSAPNLTATHPGESSGIDRSQRVLEQKAGAHPRPLKDFDPRGMSAKEIAVQKDLRVGQGPVCWPKGVKPEVIERDRLRELARAKAF
jgi:hypothetical protein